MEGWARIHSEAQPFRAELMRNRLEGAGIPAVLLNQRDSSYGFGQLELLVPETEVQRALEVLGMGSEEQDGGQ